MISVSNECPQERKVTHTSRLTHYGSSKICFALFNHLSLYTQIVLCIGVHILSAHVYLLCEHAVPAETSRGWQIPWSWDYRWLWADMWALIIETVTKIGIDVQGPSPLWLVLSLGQWSQVLKESRLSKPVSSSPHGLCISSWLQVLSLFKFLYWLPLMVNSDMEI